MGLPRVEPVGDELKLDERYGEGPALCPHRYVITKLLIPLVTSIKGSRSFGYKASLGMGG